MAGNWKRLLGAPSRSFCGIIFLLSFLYEFCSSFEPTWSELSSWNLELCQQVNCTSTQTCYVLTSPNGSAFTDCLPRTPTCTSTDWYSATWFYVIVALSFAVIVLLSALMAAAIVIYCPKSRRSSEKGKDEVYEVEEEQASEMSADRSDLDENSLNYHDPADTVFPTTRTGPGSRTRPYPPPGSGSYGNPVYESSGNPPPRHEPRPRNSRQQHGGAPPGYRYYPPANPSGGPPNTAPHHYHNRGRGGPGQPASRQQSGSGIDLQYY